MRAQGWERACEAVLQPDKATADPGPPAGSTAPSLGALVWCWCQHLYMNEAVRWDCCEPENRLGPPMKHPLHLGGGWCFLPPTDRCPVFFCFVLFVCFFKKRHQDFW